MTSNVERQAKSKEFDAFSKQPVIRQWIEGASIKPVTLHKYVQFLCNLLDGEDPAALLKRAEKKPKPTSIDLKTKLSKLSKHSPASAHNSRAALFSFLSFHETPLPLNGLKISIIKKREKPALTWQQAEGIIGKTKGVYEQAFRFMLWTGCGGDELKEINGSEQIQESIQKQMADQSKDSKDYVKIHLQPRKHTLTDYFVLCPKRYVPEFPLITEKYKDGRGDLPLSTYDLEARLRVASKAAGIYQLGLGPHTFRSVFASAAGKADVKDSVIEFQLGHGSGDKYGYRRDAMDEEFNAEQLRKLWEFNQPATKEELEKKTAEIDQLKQITIDLLEGRLEDIGNWCTKWQLFGPWEKVPKKFKKDPNFPSKEQYEDVLDKRQTILEQLKKLGVNPGE